MRSLLLLNRVDIETKHENFMLGIGRMGTMTSELSIILRRCRYHPVRANFKRDIYSFPQYYILGER